jgi:hypothetical protein
MCGPAEEPMMEIYSPALTILIILRCFRLKIEEKKERYCERRGEEEGGRR